MQENPVKLLICVISCKYRMHMWKEITEMYLSDLIIVHGNNKTEKMGEYTFDNTMLEINCDDKYEGLPEKILYMNKIITTDSRFSKYTHILKLDDNEACANTHKDILAVRNFINLNHDYIGQKIFQPIFCNRDYHFGRVDADNFWHDRSYKGDYRPFLVGGNSYILSKRASCILADYLNSTQIEEIRSYHIYEDVMVGLLLNSKQVYPLEKDYKIFSIDHDTTKYFDKHFIKMLVVVLILLVFIITR